MSIQCDLMSYLILTQIYISRFRIKKWRYLLLDHLEINDSISVIFIYLQFTRFLAHHHLFIVIIDFLCICFETEIRICRHLFGYVTVHILPIYVTC